ncbi:hypothetical protein LQZ21_04805 [Treponema sp. TIM-1]|uniref:hypothetical protein n=1 Tax=Treponema sp. TIM-1 TaxID=2898417 RepID=UPI0039812530
MFEPSEEKSQKSRELVTQAFGKKIQDPAPYTIAYGYFYKTGIFVKKISNYAVGFSEALKEIIVIPISFDGDEVGEAIRLKKDDIISAKFGLQGDLKIKSALLNGELRFIVPPYTPTTLESAYILPINQNEEAAAFRSFIKNTF